LNIGNIAAATRRPNSMNHINLKLMWEANPAAHHAICQELKLPPWLVASEAVPGVSLVPSKLLTITFGVTHVFKLAAGAKSSALAESGSAPINTCFASSPIIGAPKLKSYRQFHEILPFAGICGNRLLLVL
jgi:hypothetical protein